MTQSENQNLSYVIFSSPL